MRTLLLFTILLSFGVSAPIPIRNCGTDQKRERKNRYVEEEEKRHVKEVDRSEQESKMKGHSYHSESEHPYQIGPFSAELKAVTDKSFSILLSSDDTAQNIQFYEIIILQLNKDVDGIPRLNKFNPNRWENFQPYTAESQTEQPYIAARYNATTMPKKMIFTAGDGLHLGGYFNGPLQSGSFYVIFLRGTKRENGKTIHLVSRYITDPKVPDFPMYFHTTIRSNVQLLRLGVGLGVFAILVTAAGLGLAANVGMFGKVKRGIAKTQKSRKNHEYKRIDPHMASSSDSTCTESDTPQAVSVRAKRGKKKRKNKASQQKNRSKASRIVRFPTILDPIQESNELASPRNTEKMDRLTVPSLKPRNRNSSSDRNKSRNQTRSQDTSLQERPQDGRSGSREQQESNTSESGAGNEKSSLNSNDLMTRHKSSHHFSGMQIKTKNGHNEPSDKHSQSPVPKLDVSRLQTTPRSPQQRASQGDLSATSPDSYASSCSTPPSVTFLKTYSIPDSPNGELKVDTPKLYKQHDHQSDIKETVSVLEILRDAREESEQKKDLQRRMSVYRWLIKLKHEGHLPADMGINNILEGDVILPKQILHSHPHFVNVKAK